MDSVEKAGQISHLREELRVSQMKIEGVIRENESTRRRLHNTILELKGTYIRSDGLHSVE